mmetsp:Transcript_3424/g.10398  ORF Transcript_3424/g.10398 Transcript_3424/m.10398 type:complete len:80 (+) Transcript_3424:60-299(+)
MGRSSQGAVLAKQRSYSVACGEEYITGRDFPRAGKMGREEQKIRELPSCETDQCPGAITPGPSGCAEYGQKSLPDRIVA